ncbi:MAG TPA: sulfurtransferase [Acidimicrobiales bacterium]
MPPTPAPLVSGEQAAAIVGQPGVVVADVRWYLDGRSGRAAYEGGHIPGAVFVDVDRDLAGQPGDGRGRHPLPAPSAFAAAMAALGIGDDDHVVAYDDAGGSIAARLWWMLRVTGRRASVLDGGIAAWAGRLETGRGEPRPRGTFSARPWLARAVADADAVMAAASSRCSVVLDARAPERYRGEVEPIDARAGHIPGAASAPWSANLDPATGRFLPAPALLARYEALGVANTSDVVCYCGSGVTACHDLLAIEVAGLGQGRLYDGSWSAWSSDPTRPVAVGEPSET